MKKKIELSTPYFFGNEKKFIDKAIRSNWISSGGNMSRSFESKIKMITQKKYVLSLVNCSSALQLSVRLLKPSLNDEIIVPTTTFISTINAVIYNNCKPIFMDCDDNFLIDTNKIISFLKTQTFFERGYCYNKKTKKKIVGIILVDTFGNLNQQNKELIKICKKRNIKIILDSAESLGSSYKKKYGKNLNSNFAKYVCLSFNGNKIVTSGGGGAILFNDKKDYNKALYLSSQAKDNKTYFIHNEVGYNFRLSDLHSAIGLSQLKHLKKVIKKKNKIYEYYKKNLKKINGLRLLENPSYSKSNNWLNVLIIEKKYNIKKEKIIENFQKLGIETRSVWFPNHLQKPFKHFQGYKVKKAYGLYKKSLCLPSSYNLKISDQKRIISLLINKFKK